MTSYSAMQPRGNSNPPISFKREINGQENTGIIGIFVLELTQKMLCIIHNELTGGEQASNINNIWVVKQDIHS